MNPGFRWGIASSSFQTEGAWDSREPCIWDGFIPEHPTGEAAFHCQRFKEDVALMAELGVTEYRFSLSWGRVFLNGRYQFQFYLDLIDELVAAGIAPLVNLYHWDLPQRFQDQGGWLNPEIRHHFEEYAAASAAALGHRVSRWMTFNEPNCFVGDGIMGTVHAPGTGLGWDNGMVALANVLDSHRLAQQAIRTAVPSAEVTVALTGPWWVPASEPFTVEARQKVFAPCRGNLWTWTLFSDAFTGRGITAENAEAVGPRVALAAEKLADQSIDLMTLNLYGGDRVGEPQGVNPRPVTDVGWTYTPEIAYWGPKWFFERYGLPVLIGENGMAGLDWRDPQGQCLDPQREIFLKGHLAWMRKAIQEGVPVVGYHHWSLLDNYEWQHGFTKRFGLIYVDFDTGLRTPKSSFRAYQEIIRTQGESLVLATSQ